jgi:hypothetical protein
MVQRTRPPPGRRPHRTARQILPPLRRRGPQHLLRPSPRGRRPMAARRSATLVPLRPCRRRLLTVPSAPEAILAPAATGKRYRDPIPPLAGGPPACRAARHRGAVVEVEVVAAQAVAQLAQRLARAVPQPARTPPQAAAGKMPPAATAAVASPAPDQAGEDGVARPPATATVRPPRELVANNEEAVGRQAPAPVQLAPGKSSAPARVARHRGVAPTGAPHRLPVNRGWIRDR